MDGWIGGAGAVAGGVVVVRVSEMDADRGGARVHGAGGGRPAEGVNALYLARDKRAVRSSSWYSTNTLLSLARTR